MNTKLPELENKKLAELIGILLGDGCIGLYKCKSKDRIKIQYQVKVSLDSKNIEYIDHIEYLFESLFHIKPKTYYKKKENCADVRTFRKEIFLFLVKSVGLYTSPKWNRAKIPEMYLKNSLEKYVLRGIFDTDGSLVITNNNGINYPRLELKICPSPMQKQFIGILKRYKFNFKVQNLDKGKIRIRLNGKNELKKWMKEIGTNNPKNKEKTEKILNSRGRI